MAAVAAVYAGNNLVSSFGKVFVLSSILCKEIDVCLPVHTYVRSFVHYCKELSIVVQQGLVPAALFPAVKLLHKCNDVLRSSFYVCK